MRCTALANFGVLYFHTGRATEALEAHTKCLRLAEAHPAEQRMLLAAFANIGNMYGAMGKFHQAIELHQQQLKTARLLDDAEAIARATFNLENDHNSLGHTVLGGQYKRQKSDSRPAVLNAGLGDTFGAEIVSGWMYRHQGGGVHGPRKLGKDKVWIVLNIGNSALAYHKSTKAGLPSRCINIEEVITVGKFESPDVIQDDWDIVEVPYNTIRLETKARCYYFTAESPEDGDSWVDAIHRGRTAKNKFGTLQKRTWGKSLLGQPERPTPASFGITMGSGANPGGTQSASDSESDDEEENASTANPILASRIIRVGTDDPTRMTEDPLFHESVQNPLFGGGLDALDATDVYMGSNINNLKTEYSTVHGEQATSVAWAERQDANGVVAGKVLLLGSDAVETGSPPTQDEVEDRYDDVVDRLADQDTKLPRFTMQVGKDDVTLEHGRGGNPQAAETIPISALASAFVFGDAVALVAYSPLDSGSYDLTFYRTQMPELAHSLAAAATDSIQDMLRASPVVRRRHMAAQIGVTLGSPGQEPDVMGIRQFPSMSLGGISKNDSTVDGVELNLMGQVSHESTVDGVQLNLMGQESSDSTVDGVQLNFMDQVGRESTVDGMALKVDGVGQDDSSTDADAMPSRKGRSMVVISAKLTQGLTAVPGLGVSLSRLEAGPDAGIYITSLRPGSVGELVLGTELGLSVQNGLKVTAVNGVSVLSASLQDCGREMVKSSVAELDIEKNPFGFARLEAQYNPTAAVAAAAGTADTSDQEEYMDIADTEPAAEPAAVTTKSGYLPVEPTGTGNGDKSTAITTTPGYLPVEPTGTGDGEPADRTDGGSDVRVPDKAPGLFVLHSCVAEEDASSEGGTKDHGPASDNEAPTIEIVPILEREAVAIVQTQSGLSPANASTDAVAHDHREVPDQVPVAIVDHSAGPDTAAIVVGSMAAAEAEAAAAGQVVQVAFQKGLKGFGLVLNSITEELTTATYITDLKPEGAGERAFSASGLSTLDGLRIRAINGVDLTNATMQDCASVMMQSASVTISVEKVTREQIPAQIFTAQHMGRQRRPTQAPASAGARGAQPPTQGTGQPVHANKKQGEDDTFEAEVMRLWSEGNSHRTGSVGDAHDRFRAEQQKAKAAQPGLTPDF